jgi:hypothetical protein
MISIFEKNIQSRICRADKGEKFAGVDDLMAVLRRRTEKTQ